MITKFGHSCLLVEEEGVRVLFDPGDWTIEQNTVERLDAICITHEHGDHCSIPSLQEIRKKNPNATIYTNSGVGNKLSDAEIPWTLLEDGMEVTVQGLSICAYGKEHAEIYETLPRPHNTGYLVGGRLFHPGDSVAVFPPVPIDTLALPVVAPWLKTSEAIQYARHVKPRLCFPIHDALSVGDTFQKHPRNILPAFGIQVIDLELGVPCSI